MSTLPTISSYRAIIQQPPSQEFHYMDYYRNLDNKFVKPLEFTKKDSLLYKNMEDFKIKKEETSSSTQETSENSLNYMPKNNQTAQNQTQKQSPQLNSLSQILENSSQNLGRQQVSLKKFYREKKQQKIQQSQQLIQEDGDPQEPIQYRNIRKNFLKNICAAFLCYLTNIENRDKIKQQLQKFDIKDTQVFEYLQPNRNKILNFNLFQQMFLEQSELNQLVSNKNSGNQKKKLLQQTKQLGIQMIKEEKNLKKFLRVMMYHFLRKELFQYCLQAKRMKNPYMFLQFRSYIIKRLIAVKDC